MAFQPFGYPFEVNVRRPIAHTKAALRAGLAEWFAPKSAPRGWILGPFLCMWMTAFDRNGPMVFGFVRGNESQTRIWGRAGSDLNGTLMFLLVTAFFVFMAAFGEAIELLFWLLLFVPLAFVMLWFGNKSRHEADPIVRYIERTAVGRQSVAAQPFLRDGLDRAKIDGVELTVDENPVARAPSEQDVYDALAGLDTDGFLIVAFGPETYIQTAKEYDRYVLERRDGQADKHFSVKGGVGFDEVVNALLAFLRREAFDPSLQWEKI